MKFLKIILSMLSLITPLAAEKLNSNSQIKFLAKSKLADANGVFRTWNFKPNEKCGEIIIEMKSVDTGNSMRDNHLRGSDFFDVEKFPESLFRCKSFQKTSDAITITGDLTIKDITREIRFDLKRTANGNQKEGSAYTGTFPLLRNQFGIKYQSSLNHIEETVWIQLVLLISP